MFLRTRNIFNLIFWKTHESFHSFADSVQFKWVAVTLLFYFYYNTVFDFLHRISKNTKERNSTSLHIPFVT